MTAVTKGLRGLYAITDNKLCPPEQIVEQVESALRGGARIIQYRDKREDRSSCEEEIVGILALCHRFEALLIINDDIDLAKKTEAHGVHLGRDDASLLQARNILGPNAIIGVSCYNSLDLARDAEANGADYIAFGRFFPSRIKPEAIQAEPNLLIRAKQEITKPLVAIGGITPENGAPLIAAGADMLAVIHGVFGQQDIHLASHRLSALFTP
ncbi:MAG: thiamine phosphate synthase [Candidatus Thiodiazotropha sp. 6PLUC2]